MSQLVPDQLPAVPDSVKPTGAAAAAVLAAGIGCFTLGLLTVLAAANDRVSEVLDWYHRVGPLSGKTTGAVLGWLVAWFILHLLLRRRAADLGPITVATFILIALGWIGTFPPFFELFDD